MVSPMAQVKNEKLVSHGWDAGLVLRSGAPIDKIVFDPKSATSYNSTRVPAFFCSTGGAVRIVEPWMKNEEHRLQPLPPRNIYTKYIYI